MDTISYAGIDEATLIHALYHGTNPLGMGFLQHTPDLSVERVREILADKPLTPGRIDIDYFLGHPLKCTLNTVDKTVTTALYDRDASPGKCAQIVAKLLTRG